MHFANPPAEPISDFHSHSAQQVLHELKSETESGLTIFEAANRAAHYGKNQLLQHKPKRVWILLLNQFNSPVVWLLAAAAAIALAFGEWREASAVVLVLVINGALGFVTELRAVRSMEALRAMGTLTTRVRREGRSLLVPAEDLVPGDIVLLEGGDIVTADLRLLEVSNLEADESALTGESLAVSKAIEPVPVECVIGDRSSMVFKGTSVTRGNGTGIVVATGMHSELGKISKLVEEAAPERSPLERQLEILSGQLVRFTLIIVALIGVAGIIGGRDAYLMIESAIALAVAAIPEGLPIVATMALARGMWRMAKQNALIERLAAVETLGATSIIFTDKTGTLTENNMKLRELDLPDGLMVVDQKAPGFLLDSAPIEITSSANLERVLNSLVLCNNAELDTSGSKSTGDPLEIAFLEFARSNGVEKAGLLQQYPKIYEVAFDSVSKKMATIHHNGDRFIVAVKGAPESVLTKAIDYYEGDTKIAFTDATRKEWRDRTNSMAARGMRVLAVATKWMPTSKNEPYQDLTFLGLVGLYDPPRSDVHEVISDCRDAGIRIVMITGDHAITAGSIAVAIGLCDENPDVIEGRDLKPTQEMTEPDLDQIRATNVFARVSPSQKLDLVSIFQTDGQIVAMTGDGVNDAPALKKADIGIAMGLRGTQVAREAAAMILLDDAFKTIVMAIREGRVIFRNIQHFVMYLMSCNLSEVLVVGLAVFLGLPLPLLPLQILFLNLVTDVFPAFALGLGEEEGNVLSNKPRDPDKPVISKPMWIELIAHGIILTIATLGSLIIAHWVLLLDNEQAVTVSFLTLAFAQLWHVFNMRDPRSPMFINSITKNPYVWGALCGSTILLLGVVYVDPFAAILELRAPTTHAWAVILSMSVVPVFLAQLGKKVSTILYRRNRISEQLV